MFFRLALGMLASIFRNFKTLNISMKSVTDLQILLIKFAKNSNDALPRPYLLQIFLQMCKNSLLLNETPAEIMKTSLKLLAVIKMFF